MVLGLLRGMDPQWPDNIICPALLLLWLLLLLRGEWMLLEWVTHRLESIIIYLVPGVGGGGWDNGVFLCSRFVLELVLSWTSCEEWIEVFFWSVACVCGRRWRGRRRWRRSPDWKRMVMTAATDPGTQVQTSKRWRASRVWYCVEFFSVPNRVSPQKTRVAWNQRFVLLTPKMTRSRSRPGRDLGNYLEWSWKLSHFWPLIGIFGYCRERKKKKHPCCPIIQSYRHLGPLVPHILNVKDKKHRSWKRHFPYPIGFRELQRP